MRRRKHLREPVIFLPTPRFRARLLADDCDDTAWWEEQDKETRKRVEALHTELLEAGVGADTDFRSAFCWSEAVKRVRGVSIPRYPQYVQRNGKEP